MNFSITDFCTNFFQKTAHLVTFTEKFLNGKLHFDNFKFIFFKELGFSVLI